MGAVDVERQKPNVFRMKLLGAKVNAVTSGAQTLKDAMNEALRDWVANVRDTYYIIGTAAGPHPYPAMVRDFQSVIGREVREQMAGGRGPPARHARCLHRRRLQRHRPVPPLPRRSGRRHLRRGGGRPRPASARRIIAPRSPAAGPACCTATAPTCCRTRTARSSRAIRSRPASTIRASGPSTRWLKESGRVNYVAITDKEALEAFQLCTRLEGIIPALEPAHALAYVTKLAPTLPKDNLLVMNMCGRGDKDIFAVAGHLGMKM